eukprot:TRINITY_DN49898_c0_g2_i1.p1 TRINITY_DN49898_c0_g2~~TRINITY_DN49898_c0_g2_i1.p1  ORF type:complete len:130 (+),score=33.87 TRINITY_DN49898_c0_g2_i1:36-392(+)
MEIEEEDTSATTQPQQTTSPLPPPTAAPFAHLKQPIREALLEKNVNADYQYTEKEMSLLDNLKDLDSNQISDIMENCHLLEDLVRRDYVPMMGAGSAQGAFNMFTPLLPVNQRDEQAV